MNRQSIRAQLFAAGLFSLSAAGTIALFGAVPVIARMVSANRPAIQVPAQIFPQQPMATPQKPVVKLSRAAKPD